MCDNKNEFARRGKCTLKDQENHRSLYRASFNIRGIVVAGDTRECFFVSFCTRKLSPADFHIVRWKAKRERSSHEVSAIATAICARAYASCHALCPNVHQDDVSGAEVLPVHPLQLGQDRHSHAGDAMKGAGRRLEVQVLDDQTLAEVSEESGALAILRLPHQDRRRHLGVELGGTKRRGTGCR